MKVKNASQIFFYMAAALSREEVSEPGLLSCAKLVEHALLPAVFQFCCLPILSKKVVHTVDGLAQ